MSCRDFLTFCCEFVRFGSRQVSSERRRFLTRCPASCGRKFVLPRYAGIQADARRRVVSLELVANTIFGCSAPKGCQRRRTDGDAHPERKSPAQAADAPCADRHEWICESYEEPRARPRSLWSDGTETCALTMVPGRTPFPVPSLFPPRTCVPPSPRLSVSNGNSS